MAGRGHHYAAVFALRHSPFAVDLFFHFTHSGFTSSA
jgi:hypothetical protein